MKFCVVTQDLTEKDRPVEVSLRVESGGGCVAILVDEIVVGWIDNLGILMKREHKEVRPGYSCGRIQVRWQELR